MKTTLGSPENTHPLVEKVLESKPPIAKLIGFDVQRIGDGRAIGLLKSGPQHANPMGTLHGGCSLRSGGRGHGNGFRFHLSGRRIFHNDVSEY